MTDSLSALRETLERTLRERLAKAMPQGSEIAQGVLAGKLLDALVPPIAAALAEKDKFITTLEVEMDLPRDIDALIERAENAEAQVAEKDAQIREWETGALAASTEIVKLRQQLRETRESFEAVVRAAGPFMPPVPEKTDA